MKWAPFSSVISSKYILNEVEEKRNRIEKPVLSVDQLNYLNESLWENFYAKQTVSIKYYQNESLRNIMGIITKINQSLKIITINNQNIHLSQIIAIKKA